MSEENSDFWADLLVTAILWNLLLSFVMMRRGRAKITRAQIENSIVSPVVSLAVPAS